MVKPPAESPEEAKVIQEDGKCVLRFCSPNSTRISDVLIVFLYHMLPFTAVPITLLTLLAWHVHSTYGWWGTSIYIGVFVVLTTMPLKYDRKFRRRIQFFYTAMAGYMKDIKFIVPAKPLQRQEPHIFAYHPHGRMFYTCSMMIQTSDLWGLPFIPPGDYFGAAAAGFFAVPLIRQLLYAIGAIPAGRSDIVKRLRKKNHVAIIVGGVKEVCLGTNPNIDYLYLQKRKGFCKIAVEEKLGVVPIYTFNENQLFQHDPKWWLKLCEKVNRYVNVGVPGMRGVLGLPMPFRREILVVIGDPLYPKEGESVDDFHARYVEALQKLFARYVKFSPHPEHKLVIT